MIDDEIEWLPTELEKAIEANDLQWVEHVYSRIITYVESVLGPHHPRLAASFLQLAGFRCFHGDYLGAENCCRRAVAIYKRSVCNISYYF
ncbi:MAG TPA: hypothetical protein V6D17_17100 [Candidatus Obscuribacterales bacterium]